MAYIARDLVTSSPPGFFGLLSLDEQRAYDEGKRRADEAFAKQPTPRDRLWQAQERWKSHQQPAQAGVSGSVYWGEGLRDPAKLKAYEQNQLQGRLSFAVDPAKMPEFFEFIMSHIAKGALRDVPIKFKIDDDVRAEDYGRGESAHLYFKAPEERKVYEALVRDLYPEMQRQGLLVQGGRFMMLPVLGENRSPLAGVQFAQDLVARPDLQHLPERSKLFASHQQYATSGAMSIVMLRIGNDRHIGPNLSELRTVYKAKGKMGLRAHPEFSRGVSGLRDYLISIGRDASHPMIDRDAYLNFPLFVKVTRPDPNKRLAPTRTRR